MARPTIDEEVLDRLERTIDERTKVPASHLTTEERLAFALDELDEVDSRVERLTERVNRLESELKEARNGRQNTDTGVPGVTDPNNRF